MVTIETFVKVYRKFTEWEWYDDINVSRVFLHLLITVNWTDKRWRGQVVKRGSITSSYEKLATETGLSVMQVRTAIKKLQSTGEITSKSSNKNTVFKAQTPKTQAIAFLLRRHRAYACCRMRDFSGEYRAPPDRN